MLNGFGNYLTQLRSGNAKVYGETAFNIVSLVVGGAEIKSAVSIAKASEVESVFSKIGVFTKALGKASLENGKSLLTLPGRAVDNIGNKLTDIRELLGGKGLTYAFAHAGEGRSVLNVVGKTADDLPRNGVRNRFNGVMGEASILDDVSRLKLRNKIDGLSQLTADNKKIFRDIIASNSSIPEQLRSVEGLAKRLNDAPRYKIPESRIKKILEINPNIEARPDVTSYLPKDFIKSHLKQFDEGVVRFQSSERRASDILQYGDTLGSPQGVFVFPKGYADDMIKASGGNPRKLEELLGLPAGELGGNPLRFDIDSPENIRLSSGNEPGSRNNPDWRPGGGTYPGGIPEAVIDQRQPGSFKVTNLFGGK